MPDLICTTCSAPFAYSGESLTCRKCGASTVLVDGIPSVAGSKTYFFGELSKQRMRSLAAEIGLKGWQQAFEDVLAEVDLKLAEYIQHYIGDATRAGWKYLLKLPRDGVGLDLGCGWGETSLSLAKSLSEVVSMDLTLERLILLRARAHAMGLTNLTFVHGGDVLPLPFRNNTFDVVSLNGVLEWVPETSNLEPRAAQLAMLRDIRRVLKSDGELYIGIENRFSILYFLGRPEDHVGVKYASLLPRRMANWWCRKKIGRDYRTYTHSRGGYRRLLREAGFTNIRFFCPFPDYREFSAIVPVASASAVRGLFNPRNRLKQALLQVLSRTGLLESILPSYGIISSNSHGPSRVEQVVNHASTVAGRPIIPSQTIRFSKGEVMQIPCSFTDNPSLKIILHVPLAESVTTEKAMSAAAVKVLSERNGSATANVIPKVFAAGRSGAEFYVAEEEKPGRMGEDFPFDVPRTWNMCEQIANWLIEFQKLRVSSKQWGFPELNERWQSIATDNAFPADFKAILQARNADMSAGLRNLIGDTRLQAVATHGDLHLGNTIFDPTSNRLTGVIDWDLYESDGLPMTDLLYLLLTRRVNLLEESYESSVKQLADRSTLSTEELKLICSYEAALNQSPSHYRLFVFMMVMRNIQDVLRRRQKLFSKMSRQMLATVEFFASGFFQTAERSVEVQA